MEYTTDSESVVFRLLVSLGECFIGHSGADGVFSFSSQGEHWPSLPPVFIEFASSPGCCEGVKFIRACLVFGLSGFLEGYDMAGSPANYLDSSGPNTLNWRHLDFWVSPPVTLSFDD